MIGPMSRSLAPPLYQPFPLSQRLAPCQGQQTQLKKQLALVLVLVPLLLLAPLLVPLLLLAPPRPPPHPLLDSLPGTKTRKLERLMMSRSLAPQPPVVVH